MSGFSNWARNLRQAGTGSAASRTFGPKRASLASASASLSPRPTSAPRSAATAAASRRHGSARSGPDRGACACVADHVRRR